MFNSKKPKNEDLPSSAQLIKSTIIAIFAAIVILLTIVLPAEYGVDPTGIGKAIGLKKMGEIKASLAKELAEPKESKLISKVEIIEKTNTEKAFKVKIREIQKNKTKKLEKSEIKTEMFEYSLKPNEAIEVKLKMKKDAKVKYKWTCENGSLNHNTHGDGPGKKFYCYKKGLQIKSDEGEISAEFDGSHGWFWRNRNKKNVKVRLEVLGDFMEMKRVR